MDLNGKVAVVTGASSGIGESTAKHLVSKGCVVVLVARRKEKMEVIAEEVENGMVHVIPTDITEANEVTSMVQEVWNRFTGIDILVNNAGVLHSDLVIDANKRDFREQIQVNLLGLMNTVRTALPIMIKSGGGDIVSVSSMNARIPPVKGSAYAATKSGINSFCQSLRKEIAKENIRVTTVMPGRVMTEMNDWEEWEGQALSPSDVAETIVFAISRPEHMEIGEILVRTTDK